jgi:tRNA G18 (ribose-2'-O)-methylase SpoU
MRTIDKDTARRNVVDHFKNMEAEAVRAELDKDRSELILILENIAYDINVGGLIRTFNIMNGREIWIAGRKQWDRRGAVGTHNYCYVKYTPELSSLTDMLKDEGYTIFAAELTDDAVPLDKAVFPAKTAIILGAEASGILPETLKESDYRIMIPQRGSARSMNVTAAGSIMMYEYTKQMGLF